MSLEDFLKGNSQEKDKIKKNLLKGGKGKDTRLNNENSPSTSEDPSMTSESKLKKIRAMLKNKGFLSSTPPIGKNAGKTGMDDDKKFEDALEDFARWIRARTYIRGDIETAKQMIKNLVLLDHSLLPHSARINEMDKNQFIDCSDFLKKVKQHDAMHPQNRVLTEQQYKAMHKKCQGKKLSSTDYRHLKLLRESVRDFRKKTKYINFLAKFLEIKEFE
ncbi:MAG: hypothetical protein ACTSVI_00735 [Promethearchaeota archaeon]